MNSSDKYLTNSGVHLSLIANSKVPFSRIEVLFRLLAFAQMRSVHAIVLTKHEYAIQMSTIIKLTSARNITE